NDGSAECHRSSSALRLTALVGVYHLEVAGQGCAGAAARPTWPRETGRRGPGSPPQWAIRGHWERSHRRMETVRHCGILSRRDPARFSALSIRPVLDEQAWHLAEVLQVATDQCGSVRKSNDGDQQVGPANLLELLVLPQAVELHGDCAIDREDWQPLQIRLGLSESLLGRQQPFTILGFDE